MTTNAHTPTPWKAIFVGNDAYAEIAKNPEPTVCYCGDYRIVVDGARGYDDHSDDERDAAFIVRAVNAHEELVAALRGAMTIIDLLPVPYEVGSEVSNAIASRRENARAILAKLEAAS